MLHTMDLWNMLVLLTTRWRAYPRTKFHYSITHIQSPLTPSHPRRLDFFLKIPGPGKSWKSTFGPGKFWKLKLKVLESPGKISRKLRIFIGSNGKQTEIVNVSVCVDFYLLKWLINFAAFGFPQFLQWTILQML